ncbi:MAG: T9SS type A sorting domain-containing protein, partial [Bacteroidota bacterium]
RQDGCGTSSGQVRIYEYNGSIWMQKGTDIDGEAGMDYSGGSVSLCSDGTIVAIGAVGNDGSAIDAGHVRVYSCSSHSNINETACDIYTSPSGKYTWTSTGIYLDTIPNAMGCDNCITINLTVNNSSSSSIAESSCDSYISPSGKIWASSGVYNDTIPNLSNCDSVITIDLTINNSTNSSITETVCDSYTSPSGKTWTSTGIYLDTIPNAISCDSIITINLTVNPEYYLTENASICSGQDYTFPDGTTQTNISSQVVYTSNLLSEFNCDSIIQTTVDVNPLYNLSENVSICSGEDYTFPDGTTQTNITSQVVYTSNLLSEFNCDSIIQTTVDVNPVYNLSENVSVCSNGVYTFPDGTTQTNITTQVVHTSNLQSEFSCDSVIQTTVDVNPVFDFSENVSICSGENYTFPDGTTQTNITAQVVHTSYLHSEFNCDSIVHTTVDVNPVYNLLENVSVCSGEDYTFPDGTTQTNITAQVVYTSNFQSEFNCDSIIQTTVDVNPVYNLSENVSICSGNDYTYPDGTTQTNITTQVVYTSNLLSEFSCDSIIQTTVDVITIDTSVAQNAAVLTANTPGASYQWLDCDNSNNPISGETGQSFTAVVNGYYAVEITDNACKDTSSCYYVTSIGISKEISENGIFVYPNPSKGEFKVIAENIKSIEIYNELGQIIFQTKEDSGINISSQPKGIYFIKVITEEQIITRKLIIQ